MAKEKPVEKVDENGKVKTYHSANGFTYRWKKG